MKASNTLWVEEREATVFAYELLMPEKMVLETVEEHIGERNWFDSKVLVDLISERYDVPKEAAEKRLQQLCII